MKAPQTKKALIIVDIQNDFVPGGALPVKEGDQIIPLINRLLKLDFDSKVATKDWHPEDHGSFANVHGKQPGERINLNELEQILWPSHCVQNSLGSQFVKELDTSKFEGIFYKGADKKIDSYSVFFDNAHKKSTGLDDFLKEKNITDIYVAGLATDYCVKYSVLDALMLGYTTHIIVDACRGVNLDKNDSDRALEEMRSKGAHLINSKDLYHSFSGGSRPKHPNS